MDTGSTAAASPAAAAGLEPACCARLRASRALPTTLGVLNLTALNLRRQPGTYVMQCPRISIRFAILAALGRGRSCTDVHLIARHVLAEDLGLPILGYKKAGPTSKQTRPYYLHALVMIQTHGLLKCSPHKVSCMSLVLAINVDDGKDGSDDNDGNDASCHGDGDSNDDDDDYTREYKKLLALPPLPALPRDRRCLCAARCRGYTTCFKGYTTCCKGYTTCCQGTACSHALLLLRRHDWGEPAGAEHAEPLLSHSPSTDSRMLTCERNKQTNILPRWW